MYRTVAVLVGRSRSSNEDDSDVMIFPFFYVIHRQEKKIDRRQKKSETGS